MNEPPPTPPIPPTPGAPGAESLPDWKGFKVLQELARTPRGIVYKLRRKVEQDVIAAKFFEPSNCRKEFLDALPQTSERAFLLGHKGLVRCLGCAMVERRPLLMFEFATGESLAATLKTGQPLVPARALLAILQCATALRHAALQGQTHGRLHPADILLGEDTARIVGVGLGDQPDHASWSSPHPYAFEPLVYTAPEAMPSQKFPASLDIRASADIYALGAMLAHMLTGTAPFAGRDEASLLDERRMMGKPMQWPGDAEKRIPKLARDITERMLASGAGLRPTYDELLTKLNAAVAEAEKFQNAAALGIGTTSSLFQPVGSKTGTDTGSALMSAMTTAVAAPAAVPVPQRPRTSRLYTTTLIGMTACVFLLALALAAKIFLYDPLLSEGARNPPLPAEPVKPVPQPEPPVVAKPKAPDVAEAPVSLNTAEYAIATRQLDVIQELLKDGEIKHSPALRRRVMTIVDKAGRDTPVGVKALLLADEIEESISGPKPETKKPLVATEIPVIPGVGAAGSPLPDKPRPENSPPVAVPSVPTVATNPQPAQPNAGPATAPANPALNGAVEPVTTATPAAVPTPDQKHKEFMGSLRKAVELARTFKYQELNTELGRLNAIAVADDQKLAQHFTAIAKDEQALVSRCRARLIEQIQNHPRHESPLQVFPRKNDPQGDDIVDFDENGLKISQRKPGGAPPNLSLKSWERIPAAQALALVSLLAAERSNVDDQLGLAAFAFNRGLSNELETALNNARGIPAAKDRAEQFADRVKALNRALEK